MELGIGSYSFRWALGTSDFAPTRPLALVDLVAEAAQLGCRVLQIADNRELDSASRDELVRLLAQARSAGVRLQVGLSGASASRLAHYLDIAMSLEADLVRLVLHGEGVDPTDAQAAAVLREVADDYERAGVRVGIENHFLTPSSHMIDILDAVDSPTVGVVLDVANSIMCSEWPAETVTALAPWAFCLHLKDYRIVPDAEGVGGHIVGAPLGRGLTDIEAVLDAVAPFDVGTLAIILEQWVPRLGSVAETLAAETYWRETSVQHLKPIISARKESPRPSRRESHAAV